MTAMPYYILEADGKTPRKANHLEWAKFFSEPDARIVKSTTIEAAEVKVSTVFLGIDHGWKSVPILWETMVFGGKRDGFMQRYSSYDDALEGHAALVKFLMESEEDAD